MIHNYDMLTAEMKEQFIKFIKPMPDKGRLLETGTGYGHSATFFAALKPLWTIYTVDAFGLYGDGRIYDKWNHEDVREINMYLKGYSNIIQILADSSTVPWELPLDVLYIDADHTYEGCKADYECYAPFVKEGGLIIFDDYFKHTESNEVKRFVDELTHEILYIGTAAILRKWEFVGFKK